MGENKRSVWRWEEGGGRLDWGLIAAIVFCVVVLSALSFSNANAWDQTGTRTGMYDTRIPGGNWSQTNALESTGDKWYVDSNHSQALDAAGYGSDINRPCATLDYCIGLASSGD